MNIHAHRFWICSLFACSLFLTTGCETAKRDEELVRIDVSPHVNAVKQARQDWAWISGIDWIVASIESEELIEGSELWIRFEDHTWLIGSAGCNRLTASYDRKGIDGLKVTQIAATRRYCADPQGVMQQESRFLHLLAQCDSYAAEPDRLALVSNGIEMLIFKRAIPEEN